MTAGMANGALPGCPSCIPMKLYSCPLAGGCTVCCEALCAWPGREMASGPSCSALARQSSEKSQERNSNAGDFHYLLLHIDFFFHSAKCHHSPWVSQKLGEWARKELYQDMCSPVGLGWCAGGFVGRESCPRQLLVRLTVSKRCCWGLTHGSDCAIDADPCTFNLWLQSFHWLLWYFYLNMGFQN